MKNGNFKFGTKRPREKWQNRNEIGIAAARSAALVDFRMRTPSGHITVKPKSHNETFACARARASSRARTAYRHSINHFVSESNKAGLINCWRNYDGNRWRRIHSNVSISILPKTTTTSTAMINLSFGRSTWVFRCGDQTIKSYFQVQLK